MTKYQKVEEFTKMTIYNQRTKSTATISIYIYIPRIDIQFLSMTSVLRVVLLHLSKDNGDSQHLSELNLARKCNISAIQVSDE